ncbi:MAG: DUF5686 and carboxypeptidase regulatory-like domain-containing protein [Cyclobacteriaceae bacterium]|nr:DUF5686 and carboxypeptidase regulatory-like domain-containing protein [Cyclobacteriaceae bacterium]
MIRMLNVVSFMINHITTCLLLVIPQLILAQSIDIRGHVKEKGFNEPVPFVHIFFKGTQQGTTTNLEGDFILKIKNGDLPSDTLIISSIGYKTKRIHVVTDSRLSIELEPELTLIDEVVITAGENPAFAMMEKIISKKKKNNPYNHDSYSCNEYSKIRFDLNHFTEKIKENYLLKPFDYIWDNVDTTSDGVTFLPILLVEKMSNHYYRKSPKKEKSVITAKKITGLPGPKIMEFVDDLYFTPNVYDDYVVILDKNFPSPLNSNYKLHYDYYLDSTGVGINKEYNIVFQPKLKRELAFTGEMSIDAESYAVKKVSLRFDIMANVNFVRSYLVQQKYEKINNTNWMLTESNVIGDFTVIENSSDLTGFFGRKNSSFSNYTIDAIIPDENLAGIEALTEKDSAEMYDDQFWENERTDSLSEHELSVKNMVTRLESDPKFIFRKNLLVGVATGYVPIKQLDVGNFYSFYSYNFVEKSRVKLGFRSKRSLNYPLSGSAYLAYGVGDDRFKYGVDAQLKLDKKNKTRIGIHLNDDIVQLGRSFNAITIDHVISTLVQIGDVTSRVYSQDYNAFIEHNIVTGLVGRLNYFNTTISPTDTVIFRSYNDVGVVQNDPNYIASGLDFTLKFNWQNKRVRGIFHDKNDIKNNFRKFPDVTLYYKYADEEFGSRMNFQKIKGSLNQQILMRNLGFFKYYIEAGKTLGTVPYSFLDTPFSNQLVLADDFAFNLMNYLEFVSDEYIMANVQHHFDGAILDKIPLLNQLKWRSFVFAKGYWGVLSEKNYQAKYILLENTDRIRKPYYEVGFGIENIFKIARMDFVWRLNQTSLPDTYNFIIKPSFSFSF